MTEEVNQRVLHYSTNSTSSVIRVAPSASPTASGKSTMPETPVGDGQYSARSHAQANSRCAGNAPHAPGSTNTLDRSSSGIRTPQLPERQHSNPRIAAKYRVWAVGSRLEEHDPLLAHPRTCMPVLGVPCLTVRAYIPGLEAGSLSNDRFLYITFHM